MQTVTEALKWTSDNWAAISTILAAMLGLVAQWMARRNVAASQAVRVMADQIEQAKAEDVKARIEGVTQVIDQATKDVIANAAAHADPAKPNPKGAMLLNVTLGILRRTDVIGMLANKLKGK